MQDDAALNEVIEGDIATTLTIKLLYQQVTERLRQLVAYRPHTGTVHSTHTAHSTEYTVKVKKGKGSV